MSREDGNYELQKSIPNGYEGTYQEVMVKTFGALVSVLIDISLSLAIIADKIKEGEK